MSFYNSIKDFHKHFLDGEKIRINSIEFVVWDYHEIGLKLSDKNIENEFDVTNKAFDNTSRLKFSKGTFKLKNYLKIHLEHHHVKWL